MHKSRLLFLLTLAFCMSLSVFADNVSGQLSVFNQHPTVTNANSFFSLLSQEEFLDAPIVMPVTASTDTLQAAVWYWASEWYYDVQDFRLAAQYGEQALPLCNKVGDKTMEADCASLLGLIYVRLGEFDKAAVYAKRCNELDLESGDANNIASSYNTLAGIYMSMRQTDEAERYILKAIEYVEQTDNMPRKAVIYGMASEVYQNLYRYDYRLEHNDKEPVEKTLDYATRAWEIEKQLDRPMHAAIRQTQRASALTVLERYDEAGQALLEAMPVLEASGNMHSLGIAYNQMGDLLYVQGRNQEAADYYYKALDIFTAQHDIYNEAHTQKGLRESLRGIDPEKALAHGDRFEHLRDSIYDREKSEQLSQYAAELDNDILQQANDRQRKQHIRQIVLILAAVVIAILVFVVTYRHRKRQQQQEIGALIQEIEKLQKQMKSAHTVKPADEQKEDFNYEQADDETFLGRVIELVNEGMENNEFSIEHLAAATHTSVSTFSRRIKRITGNSPKTFILAIQMEHAAELLAHQTDLSISAVAEQCGFADAGSFARTFRQYYGITPSQFREEKRKNDY